MVNLHFGLTCYKERCNDKIYQKYLDILSEVTSVFYRNKTVAVQKLSITIVKKVHYRLCGDILIPNYYLLMKQFNSSILILESKILIGCLFELNRLRNYCTDLKKIRYIDGDIGCIYPGKLYRSRAGRVTCNHRI